MEESPPQLVGASTGRFQLVVLPRDPQKGYVYWEWPAAQQASSPAQLTLQVRDSDGSWRAVHSFEVTEKLGSRFFDFSAPDVLHRCCFEDADGARYSEPVKSPRRQPGGRPVQFVTQRPGADGLQVEPTDYDDPVHGSFPAAIHRPPSSHAGPDDNG